MSEYINKPDWLYKGQKRCWDWLARMEKKVRMKGIGGESCEKGETLTQLCYSKAMRADLQHTHRMVTPLSVWRGAIKTSGE